MLRQVGATLAAMAFVCGLSAAPHTHAHRAIDSVTDEHHPHGATLVHTHASPHSHRDADYPDHQPSRDEDRADQIWSVDSFVFQQPVPNEGPSPVLLVCGEPHIQLARIWLSAHWPHPMAHGPPLGSPTAPRAPPALLPPFV